MSTSLRRSRRATKKDVSEYNVGDIVEVSKSNPRGSIDSIEYYINFSFDVGKRNTL